MNERPPTSLPMKWLAAGVPLSLLIDLAVPPDSAELLRHEPPDGAMFVDPGH